MTFSIRLPKRLDVAATFKLGHDFRKLKKRISSTDKLVLDTRPLKWVEPFGMLYLAKALSLFRTSCSVEVLEPEDEQQGYARFIGFFHALSADGSQVVSALNGRLISARADQHDRIVRYLPIYRVRLTLEDNTTLYNTIRSCANELANVIAGETEGKDVKWFFRYVFEELLKNVYEHSEADEFQICGQYWPHSSQAEIAIIDDGIGIRTSLSHNPLYKNLSDYDALMAACEKGVSGRAFSESDRDMYENAGLGLYTLKLLGMQKDNRFVLCSDNTALMFNGTETSRCFDSVIKGTAASLRVTVNRNGRESLRDFVVASLDSSRSAAQAPNRND